MKIKMYLLLNRSGHILRKGTLEEVQFWRNHFQTADWQVDTMIIKDTPTSLEKTRNSTKWLHK
jgi:hypothetical protein